MLTFEALTNEALESIVGKGENAGYLFKVTLMEDLRQRKKLYIK